MKTPYLFSVEHYTKPKSISIQMLKSSHVRPPYTKQINTDPEAEIMSNYIPGTETRSISTTETKPKSFSKVTPKTNRICGPYPKTESISTTTTHAQTKSIDHYAQNKLISPRTRSISIPRTKTSHFRSQHQNQLKFDPSPRKAS